MTDLINKYRPNKLSDIIGQDHIVNAFKGMVEKGSIPHSYLLHGLSGTGKTTLARIIANHVGCVKEPNLIEYNASIRTGVDDTRNMLSTFRYYGSVDNPNKVIIVDESHNLSASAFDAMLKDLEEPPDHVYIIFITTNYRKVPKTIKTRCVNFEFKPIKVTLIEDVLDAIDLQEGYNLGDYIDVIAQGADGSVRKAIRLYEACIGCKNRSEAMSIVRGDGLDDNSFTLIQGLVKDELPWRELVKLFNSLDVSDYNGLRYGLINYTSKVLTGTVSSDRIVFLVFVVEVFSEELFKPIAKAQFIAKMARIKFRLE